MPTAQDCRSLTGGAACPRHERCFGSDNRGLRVLWAHVGHKRQEAVISRVTHLKRWHAALGRWTNQLSKGRPKVRQVQTSSPRDETFDVTTCSPKMAGQTGRAACRETVCPYG